MKAQVIWIRAILLLAAAVVSHESIAGGFYNLECGEGRYILTSPEPAEPRIHGPAVFGVRPGSPFLYTIQATGQRPMEFAVEGLPDGLTVDRASGVISGKITSGEKRNCWGHQVDQDKVLASARAMAEKGLKDYGWTYVNIDDAWQGERGGKYNGIQRHPEKFPDMGQLCDEIHALGLKVGIYSLPWLMTYAGFIGGSSSHPDGVWDDDAMRALHRTDRKRFFRVGSYTFDENDVAQWAEWGIDYRSMTGIPMIRSAPSGWRRL